MKTKLVAMLLLAITIFSCKKEESIQPKQCWNFSSKIIFEWNGNWSSTKTDTFQATDTTICNLTEIEAEYVRDTIQSSIKGSYPWDSTFVKSFNVITTKKVVK